MSSDSRSVGTLLIAGSGILAAIAALLPWYTIDSILGTTTTYGFQTDGVLTFLLSLLVLGIIYVREQNRLETAALSVLGVGITLLGYYTFSQVAGNGEYGYYGTGSPSPHIGVYLTMVAGAMILLSTIYGPIRARV